MFTDVAEEDSKKYRRQRQITVSNLHFHICAILQKLCHTVTHMNHTLVNDSSDTSHTSARSFLRQVGFTLALWGGHAHCCATYNSSRSGSAGRVRAEGYNSSSGSDVLRPINRLRFRPPLFSLPVCCTLFWGCLFLLLLATLQEAELNIFTACHVQDLKALLCLIKLQISYNVYWRLILY